MAFSGSGSGTQGDPYLITDTTELQEVNDDTTAYYKLMNDLDLTSVSGFNISTFSGEFDGNGKVLSNYTVSGASGFFGELTGSGTVEYLGIENADVDAGAYSGILVGWMKDNSRAEYCYTTGYISGSTASWAPHGGVVGFRQGGTIRNCWTSATVTRASGQSRVAIHTGRGGCGAYNFVYGDFDGVPGNAVSGDGSCPSSCFYDTDKTSATSGGGSAVGKTTSELQTQSTYTNAGYDFTNVWTMGSSGYAIQQVFDTSPSETWTARPSKEYDGSWTEHTVKVYDGTSWVPRSIKIYE